MAERRLPIPERPWHKSKSGCWSLSLGVRGLKVRVQQHKSGGTFQRVYRVGRRVTYASLGTTDRQEARRLAIEFIRELEKDRKSTRLNSSHSQISYAVFCLKKKKRTHNSYHVTAYIASCTHITNSEPT